MKTDMGQVLCPVCERLLLVLEPKRLGHGRIAVGPAIRRDAEGAFLVCQWCGSRVALRPSPSASGWGFDLDVDRARNRDRQP